MKDPSAALWKLGFLSPPARNAKTRDCGRTFLGCLESRQIAVDAGLKRRGALWAPATRITIFANTRKAAQNG
jgi:hypothetical protein